MLKKMVHFNSAIRTSARRSKRANNSFNIFTKSGAEYFDEIAVNPTMSAYKILRTKDIERKDSEMSKKLNDIQQQRRT